MYIISLLVLRGFTSKCVIYKKGEMEEGSTSQVLEKKAMELSSSKKRDVGGMGWRLGRLLTKMHKDRYGPKVRYIRFGDGIYS